MKCKEIDIKLAAICGHPLLRLHKGCFVIFWWSINECFWQSVVEVVLFPLIKVLKVIIHLHTQSAPLLYPSASLHGRWAQTGLGRGFAYATTRFTLFLSFISFFLSFFFFYSLLSFLCPFFSFATISQGTQIWELSGSHLENNAQQCFVWGTFLFERN